MAQQVSTWLTCRSSLVLSPLPPVKRISKEVRWKTAAWNPGDSPPVRVDKREWTGSCIRQLHVFKETITQEYSQLWACISKCKSIKKRCFLSKLWTHHPHQHMFSLKTASWAEQDWFLSTLISGISALLDFRQPIGLGRAACVRLGFLQGKRHLWVSFTWRVVELFPRLPVESSRIPTDCNRVIITNLASSGPR